MQERYTKLAQRVIKRAKDISRQLGHNYVGSEHLLVGLSDVENGVASVILSKHNIEKDKLVEMICQYIMPQNKDTTVAEAGGITPKARDILNNSIKEADRFKSKEVGTEHILIALIKETECAASRLLATAEVNPQKIYADILTAMGEKVSQYKKDFDFNQSRAVSQTGTLEQYSRDLTKMVEDEIIDPVIGRNSEIERIIQILSRRTKNNPCLVGEPGVGKTAIVEALAQRIHDGNVPETLMNKRLCSLDMSGMVAGSKYRGEFEERIKKIINEVSSAGNILLFIDEIHTIIGAGGAEGAIDASNILKPALARGEIQIIGATTLDEYRKHFEKDAALERRFQPVTIEEPTEMETIDILKGLRSKYEEHHKVTITDEALNSAVTLSRRYITDRFLPDKAIDLMDEACSRIRMFSLSTPNDLKKLQEELSSIINEKEEAIINQELDKVAQITKQESDIKESIEKSTKKWNRSKNSHRYIVTENEIAEVVANWTKIPVKKLAEEETTRLKKLEKILHERVIGQDEAVIAVSKAIRRGRVGLKDPKRPIGSFLFLGPTGVGKTELSKALAEAVFGTEDSIIRVDMSEYMEKHSVSKMVGSPPGYVGYDEGGQLSEKVRRNPYSVILFDEIEKAHPDVFNILLQVLDDGRITDSRGRKINFKNTVIIMTSNAGAERIIEPKKLGFASQENDKQNYEMMKSGVMEEVKRIFKPEFINRIDDIIVFHSLTKEDIRNIVNVMLKGMSKRIKNQLNITLDVTPAAKSFIADKGYDRKYGARPLRRSLQNLIEDALAEEILDGKVKSGDKVQVSVSDKKLKFNVKCE